MEVQQDRRRHAVLKLAPQMHARREESGEDATIVDAAKEEEGWNGYDRREKADEDGTEHTGTDEKEGHEDESS